MNEDEWMKWMRMNEDEWMNENEWEWMKWCQRVCEYNASRLYNSLEIDIIINHCIFWVS